MTGLLKDLWEGYLDFGRTSGDYWSKDNAKFEATNPSFMDRVGRAVNPMTSFGSALGAWSDAAGKGFPVTETGAALMQALPTFGSVARVLSGDPSALATPDQKGYARELDSLVQERMAALKGN